MSILRRLSRDVGLGGLMMILIMAAGCQRQAPAPDETPPGPDPGEATPVAVYAFTLLAPSATGSTLAVARVVIDQDAAACPTLISGADSVLTLVRQSPALGDFSGVTVCEAAVDFGKTYTATVSGTPITLQPVQEDPARVLVYGDTGCHHSDCEAAAASPFDTLATAGAGLSPTLLLHMGDYNYRGTSGHIDQGTVYDAGDITAPGGDPKDCQLKEPYYSQNAAGNGPADNWTDWQLDFFEPAQPLLPAAPWVFARGNHELCSRAGPRFYFLGPGSATISGAITPYSCPDQTSDTDVLSHVVFIEPYLIGFGSLRVMVIDSANACDDHAPEATTAIYGAQFAKLAAMTARDTTTWLMTHRPLWGVNASHTINHTLRDALRDSLNDALPSAVALSLAGHMHYFQSLAFTAGGRPPQLVIGNSGVSLYGDPTGDFCHTVDSMQANGNGLEAHGFLSATLNTDGTWSGDLVGLSSTVARCGSAMLPDSICTLVASPGGQGCATASP